MSQGYINTVAVVVVQLSRNTAQKIEFTIQEHEDLVTLIEEIVNEKLFLCSKVSQSETYLEPCQTSTMECLTKSKLVYFFQKKFSQKYLARSTAFLMLINLSCSYFISLLFIECFKIFLSSTKLSFYVLLLHKQVKSK